MLRVAHFIEDHAADSAHYEERPVAHQEDRHALHRLHKAGPALPQGVLDAGANVIVAGSAVFKNDAAANTREFLEIFSRYQER